MGSIRHSLIECAVVLVTLALMSGCFAVADLDRFHAPDDAGADDAAVDDAGSDSSSRD